MTIGLVAQPWWVNLIVLVPLLAWFSWRRGGVPIPVRQLVVSGAFAVSFGFLEAAVVVYLRAAMGLLPGYQGTLSDVIRMSGQFYVQSQVIRQFPKSLLTLEVLREAVTILMLLSVALLTSARSRARAAVFLWTFAIWDMVYYAALWATVRWPLSLNDPDVLFLIPVPWVSPVWFPLLVSALSLAAVLLSRVRQQTADRP
ncbi:MAG: hypothetical protein DMG70_32965 [Acidobacteria bacterium]|nr:MAG: hypothetical protein DMG70_32965 [Acidobacteriota bacterium]